jgi:hypothetical protein
MFAAVTSTQKLTRAWRNEKLAPELLHYEHALLADIQNKVDRQVINFSSFNTFNLLS